MFGFWHKDKTPKTLSVTEWLNKADAAYNYACQTKLTRGLGDFFVQDAFNYINNKINQQEKEYAGLSRYRHVKFTLIEKNAPLEKYRREVTYDNVKIHSIIEMSVGDAYTEDWTVDTSQPKLIINKIRRAIA